jgi:MOSC domain-containing protein YiiM
MGTIIRITQFTRRKGQGINKAEAELCKNSGLIGDAFADGGERQISLLTREISEAIQGEMRGLCTVRYKSTLLVDGIAAHELKSGARFTAGSAVLEITQNPKQCFAECPLAAEGTPCHLAGQYLFAKVVQSGHICAGDRFVRKE